MRPTVLVPLPADPAAALAVLEGLAAQPELPEHDVVLIDDAAPALAPLLARIEAGAEIVRLPEPAGPAAAVQAGVAQAPDAGVLVVLEPGAVPAPGFLAPLLDALADPGVAVAASTPAARPGADAASASAGGSAAHPADAPAVAVRRDDLLAAGGVPAVTVAAVTTAIALSLAARGRVALVPASVVARAEDHAPVRARGSLGADVELTVVVPTLDATSARTRACVRAVQASTDVPHEIVIVDNGAPPQGFSAPVNAGLRAARGRYAVVLNDDVEVLPGWWPPLRDALDAGAAVAFPSTVGGFDRDDFAAWCFAVSRDTLDRHAAAPGEFLDPELKVWFQDTDLLQRLRAAGTPPVRVLSSQVRHATSTTIATLDPELQDWLQGQIARDREAFERRHPDVQLVERVVA